MGKKTSHLGLTTRQELPGLLVLKVIVICQNLMYKVSWSDVPMKNVFTNLNRPFVIGCTYILCCFYWSRKRSLTFNHQVSHVIFDKQGQYHPYHKGFRKTPSSSPLYGTFLPLSSLYLFSILTIEGSSTCKGTCYAKKYQVQHLSPALKPKISHVIQYLFGIKLFGLMSYPKCRSVEVINNPTRPGLNHREVNYIKL